MYDNIGGFDQHTYICNDCFDFLHYAERYNIVIEAVDLNSVANNDLLNRDWDWKREADSGDEA